MKDLKQIEQYTSYPKYKDSGIEWLGKVPEHWKIGRLKNSIKSVSNGVWGNEPQFDENDIVCLRVADFNRDDLTINVKNLTVRNVKPNDKNKRLIEFGDLLLEKSGGGDLQPVGFVVRFTHNFPAICSNFIARIQTNELSDSNYFKYVHNTLYNLRINKRSIKQTTGIQNLDQELYFNEVVPFPPLKEQKEIADFLDHKTSQIDSIIKDKERLIECLKEYRQAIINEAVTKGLSPETAKMKDSGVEWIGEIPEHWGIVKLKYIGEAIIGLTYAPTDVVSESEKGNLVLRSSNIRDGKIVFENNVFVDKIIPDKLKTRAGDILICSRNGSRELIGKCALIDRDSEGLTFGAFMTVFRSQYNKFLYYVFQSQLFKAQIGSFLTSTINQLTIGNLYSFPIALPDKQEQEDIAEYLTKKTTEIDILIEDQRTVINKLKEYRQSLIYEAVTGKIDVRGFQKGE